MKSIAFFLISLPILISCGGGSSVDVVIPQLSYTNTATTPVTPTVNVSSTILPTAVIDGYVSGANVYVDMNWNFMQDQGEPSATEDIQSQTYDFLSSEFAAVNDFTEACAANRPRIAEVPIGAEDSVRGTVTEAYTMVYFPKELNSTEERANVTPFTSLFTGFVLDSLDFNTISVANSCHGIANQTADAVLEKVQEVLNDLQRTFGIIPDYFYDDFIQSLDANKQQVGEFIVDFLITIHQIEGILEEFYDRKMLSYPSTELVSTILSGTPFDTVTFHLVSNTIPEELDNYFQYSRRHAYSNLVANSTGQILDGNGNPVSITLANIQANSDTTISENYESIGDSVVSGRYVHMSIEDNNGVGRTFIRFIRDNNNSCHLTLAQYGETWGNEKRATNGCANQEYTELRFLNTLNPYFDYNVSDVIQSRDIATINMVFNDLFAMPTGIDERDNMTYYLLSDDELVFESVGPTVYVWNYNYKAGMEREWCEKISLTNGSLIQRYTGSDAYPTCQANM